MTTPRMIGTLVLVALVSACGYEAPDAGASEGEAAAVAGSAGPAYLAHHRYNPTSDEAHRV